MFPIRLIYFKAEIYRMWKRLNMDNKESQESSTGLKINHSGMMVPGK